MFKKQLRQAQPAWFMILCLKTSPCITQQDLGNKKTGTAGGSPAWFVNRMIFALELYQGDNLSPLKTYLCISKQQLGHEKKHYERGIYQLLQV